MKVFAFTRSFAVVLILSAALCPSTIRAQTLQLSDREKAQKKLQLIKDHLTGQDFDQPWLNWPEVEDQQLLAYLKQSTEGDPLRAEAITLARRYARPADLTKKPDRGPAYHNLAHDQLGFAWRVLMETGVLHNGMTLEEAAAILGAPNRVYGNKASGKYIVDWTYESTMHVNPALRATIKSDVIEKIERVSL